VREEEVERADDLVLDRPAPLTRRTETSISLDRYSTWGDRPAPRRGTMSTTAKIPTSANAGR
jgi:hypothetical protein